MCIRLCLNREQGHRSNNEDGIYALVSVESGPLCGGLQIYTLNQSYIYCLLVNDS